MVLFSRFEYNMVCLYSILKNWWYFQDSAQIFHLENIKFIQFVLDELYGY